MLMVRGRKKWLLFVPSTFFERYIVHFCFRRIFFPLYLSLPFPSIASKQAWLQPSLLTNAVTKCFPAQAAGKSYSNWQKISFPPHWITARTLCCMKLQYFTRGKIILSRLRSQQATNLSGSSHIRVRRISGFRKKKKKLLEWQYLRTRVHRNILRKDIFFSFLQWPPMWMKYVSHFLGVRPKKAKKKHNENRLPSLFFVYNYQARLVNLQSPQTFQQYILALC